MDRQRTAQLSVQKRDSTLGLTFSAWPRGQPLGTEPPQALSTLWSSLIRKHLLSCSHRAFVHVRRAKQSAVLALTGQETLPCPHLEANPKDSCGIWHWSPSAHRYSVADSWTGRGPGSPECEYRLLYVHKYILLGKYKIRLFYFSKDLRTLPFHSPTNKLRLTILVVSSWIPQYTGEEHSFIHRTFSKGLLRSKMNKEIRALQQLKLSCNYDSNNLLSLDMGFLICIMVCKVEVIVPVSQSGFEHRMNGTQYMGNWKQANKWWFVEAAQKRALQARLAGWGKACGWDVHLPGFLRWQEHPIIFMCESGATQLHCPVGVVVYLLLQGKSGEIS